VAWRLLALAGAVLAGAIPANAGTLSFYSQRWPDDGLYAQSSSGGPLRLLRTSTDPSAGAVWAPNGRHYLFALQGVPSWTTDLWIADADGSNAHLLANDARGARWSLDSHRIAFSRESALWTIRSDGSGAHMLVGPTAGDPRWSPGGRSIAFLQASPGGTNDSALALVDAGSGKARVLAQCVYWGGSWSPSGNRIAFDSCGPNGRDTAKAGVYVQDLRSGARRRVASDAAGPVSWSPDGAWVAFFSTGDPPMLELVRPNGRDPHTLAPASLAFDIPWSPDSRQLAFTYGNPSDVWVVGINGHPSRVTRGWRYGYWSGNPSWAPRDVVGRVVDPALPTDSVVVDGTLESVRLVESLAADGDRVAIGYGVGPTPGKLIETWDAPTSAIVRFDETGWQAPALAGDRLAVPQYMHAAGVNFYEIALSSIEHPASLRVTGLCRPGDGPPNGPCIRDPIADVAGHGNLLVFDGWQGPQPWCNQPCPPPKRNGILFRVDDGAAVQIATSALELTPLAVDADRILVNAGGGTLAVLDIDGKTLVTVPAPAFTEAKLQGDDLVVHSGAMLDDYDAVSGALLHEYALPPAAVLEDVQDGVAAYVASSDIHLLHLASGEDDVISPPGHGPLHAQLEPGALFYSYAVDDAARPGRVAFIRR
jgi:WD40 repeat protein